MGGAGGLEGSRPHRRGPRDVASDGRGGAASDEARASDGAAHANAAHLEPACRSLRAADVPAAELHNVVVECVGKTGGVARLTLGVQRSRGARPAWNLVGVVVVRHSAWHEPSCWRSVTVGAMTVHVHLEHSPTCEARLCARGPSSIGPRVVSPHPQGLQGSHLNLSQTSA